MPEAQYVIAAHAATSLAEPRLPSAARLDTTTRLVQRLTSVGMVVLTLHGQQKPADRGRAKSWPRQTRSGSPDVEKRQMKHRICRGVSC